MQIEHAASLILPYALTLVSGVLSVLMAILLKKLGRIDELAKKFDEHILNFTRVMANVMTLPACREVREDCVKLNQRIIQEPLKKALEEHITISDKRHSKLEQEAEELWLAVRHHIHTDRGTVIEPK